MASPAKGFDLLDRKQQLGRRAIRLEKAPGRQVPYRLCREGELVRDLLDRQQAFPVIFHVIPFWPQSEAKSLPVLSERIIAWDFGGRGGTWSPYVGLDTASRRLAFDTHKVRASSLTLADEDRLKTYPTFASCQIVPMRGSATIADCSPDGEKISPTFLPLLSSAVSCSRCVICPLVNQTEFSDSL